MVFHNNDSYFTTHTTILVVTYISACSEYRLVHSEVRQFTLYRKHSHHRYFIDTIGITDTTHLWVGFEYNSKIKSNFTVYCVFILLKEIDYLLKLPFGLLSPTLHLATNITVATTIVIP